MTPQIAFAVCAALYTGFQWTIRMVVYPQFAAVGRTEFPVYERRHQARLTIAVGPLFALLFLSTGILYTTCPGWAVVASLLLAVILAVTAWAAVPLHRRLGVGFDPLVLARLLRVDTVRLIAAGADTALGVYLLIRG